MDRHLDSLMELMVQSFAEWGTIINCVDSFAQTHWHQITRSWRSSRLCVTKAISLKSHRQPTAHENFGSHLRVYYGQNFNVWLITTKELVKLVFWPLHVKVEGSPFKLFLCVALWNLSFIRHLIYKQLIVVILKESCKERNVIFYNVILINGYYSGNINS
jgi:hypothetical protein